MALMELERLLAADRFDAELVRPEAAQITDASLLPVPAADVHVVEAFEKGRGVEVIACELLSRDPEARVLAVLEQCDEVDAFPLLQLGVKGLICYSELPLHLGRAIRELAEGGFWVRRLVLSRFVDKTLAGARRPRPPALERDLSRREREVHELLMQNFSNKEIARRLHLGERTVKFHVSNLLGKHGVRRRADLILLSSMESRRIPTA